MLTRPPGGPTQDVGRHRQPIPGNTNRHLRMSPGHPKGRAALRSTAKSPVEVGTVLWMQNPGISGREEVGFARHSPSGARVAAIRTTRKFARVAVVFTANPGHPKGRTALVARWAQDRSLRITGPERRETVPASFFLFFHQRRARLLPIPEGTGFRRDESDEPI